VDLRKKKNKSSNITGVATINSPQPPMQAEKTTLEVIGLSDANPIPLPTTDIDCPECGNKL
jgi:hypothetical protein